MHSKLLGVQMAKPIRATPTLVGQEAIVFLKKMKKNNTAVLTKADKKLLDLITESKPVFSLANAYALNNRP